MDKEKPESPISKSVVEEKPLPIQTPVKTPVKTPASKPLVRPKPLVLEKPLGEEKKQSQSVTPKPKATVAAPKRENPVASGLVIPEQSGNCKDLRTKGITNIDVKVNPWASDLDRDDDGIACESR